MPRWCDRSDLEIKYDQVWDEYNKAIKALEVAESALRTAIGHEPFEGLEPRKCSEALEQINRIKNGH